MLFSKYRGSWSLILGALALAGCSRTARESVEGSLAVREHTEEQLAPATPEQVNVTPDRVPEPLVKMPDHSSLAEMNRPRLPEPPDAAFNPESALGHVAPGVPFLPGQNPAIQDPLQFSPAMMPQPHQPALPQGVPVPHLPTEFSAPNALPGLPAPPNPTDFQASPGE